MHKTYCQLKDFLFFIFTAQGNGDDNLNLIGNGNGSGCGFECMARNGDGIGGYEYLENPNLIAPLLFDRK